MGRTGIQQIVALREGQGDKTTLSRELVHILEHVDRQALNSLAVSILRGVQPRCLPVGDILKTPMSAIRCTTYQAPDGDTHVALGVAYLQDYRNPDPTLDATILDATVNYVRSVNLDQVITDITINNHQHTSHPTAPNTTDSDSTRGRQREEDTK
jgi:hypothetical protein